MGGVVARLTLSLEWCRFARQGLCGEGQPRPSDSETRSWAEGIGLKSRPKEVRFDRWPPRGVNVCHPLFRA